ncbi:hypothetical protein ES707_12581 [subsurface metagenome]
MVESKEDGCVIGLDPADCWVTTGCRYLSRELGVCNYGAVRDAERGQRQVEGYAGSNITERIRINR